MSKKTIEELNEIIKEISNQILKMKNCFLL